MNNDSQNQTTEKQTIGQTINSAINSHANLPVTDVSTSRSIIDPVFWLLALALFVGATLIPQYLPAYWAPAADVWVRVSVVTAMIVLAMVLLYITSQGKAFVVLLKDSRTELRRITWPTKTDTLQTTWVVLVVVVVMAIILWLMDLFFGWAIRLVIG